MVKRRRGYDSWTEGFTTEPRDAVDEPLYAEVYSLRGSMRLPAMATRAQDIADNARILDAIVAVCGRYSGPNAAYWRRLNVQSAISRFIARCYPPAESQAKRAELQAKYGVG